MRKALLVAFVLMIYADVAFSQSLFTPFPNPVDNSEGCRIAIITGRGEINIFTSGGQRIGTMTEGPKYSSRFNYYYYYYETSNLQGRGSYYMQFRGTDGKIKKGVFTVEQGLKFQDGRPRCAASELLEREPEEEALPPEYNLEGIISDSALSTVIRTTIDILFARPLEASIQPVEQSTVPQSLKSVNSLLYTVTLRNPNSFPLDAKIDNLEDITRPATLSITRAGAPLAAGRLAQIAGGGELAVQLTVSSPDECPNVGDTCRKDFSIKVSSYQGTRKIGDATVSAAYILVSSPSPKIMPVENEATEKEGAINAITRQGAPVEYSFYVFDDESVNSGFVPYDVLLTQRKLTGTGTWAVSVQSRVTIEKIVQKTVGGITEMKDGMKRVTVSVSPPSQSPSNSLKPGDEATFEITARRSGTTDAGSKVVIKYTISTHGDGVCDPDESTETYPQDCKADDLFGCAFNGRCERREDNGVSFSAALKTDNPRNYDFLICKSGVAEDVCLRAVSNVQQECSFTKNMKGPWEPKSCIAGTRVLPQGASAHEVFSACADKIGEYYLLAATRGISPQKIKSANTYRYECPFIDIPSIDGVITNLRQTRTNMNGQKATLIEENNEIQTKELAGTATSKEISTKAQNAICIDTYASIFLEIDSRIASLTNILNTPSLSAASQIYGDKSLYEWDADFQGDIALRQANGCFSELRSILNIESATFTPASVRGGESVALRVVVTKTGTQDYYGSVSCNITKPGESKQTIQLTPQCVRISEEIKNFGAEITTANSGALTGTCTVYGSLKNDCSSATIHDKKDVSGSVYSIQYSVSSVSGSNAICTDASGAAAPATMPCTVTLNGNEQARTGFAAHPEYGATNFTCARCSITRSSGKTEECTFTSRNGLSSVFNCQAAGVGTYNLKGYVVDNEDCKPATPQDSQTSGILSTDYLCYGPGDGSLTAGEECDPARTAQQTVTDCNNLGRSSPHWTCNQQSRCVDSTAPAISNIGISGTSILQASTNEVARCKYDEQDKPYYNTMTPDETPYGSSHRWTVLGLTNTPRTLYIKCTDGTNIGTATFDASLSAACTGTAPQNAVLCTDDDSELTSGAARTLVEQCSANKCEYICDASSGYVKQGNSCIKPNEPPVISGVAMQGSCIIGNTITVTCSASDPDGTLSSPSGVIKINGATQPATFANGVYTTSAYQIIQTAGTEIKATCFVTDSSRESTNLTGRLCTVQVCPNMPTFNSISISPKEPPKGGLVEIRFTSSKALTQNPQIIIKAGSTQAAAAIDSSRSSGLNYVYSARLPAYAGDAMLVIRGQSEANCIGEATRPFLAVASAGAPKPSSVIVTANPAAISADGTTRSTIAATFRNAAGAPMPYESTVSLSTTSGSIMPSCATRADESTCFAYLTSSQTPGEATVTAAWNGLSGITAVSFLTPAPTDIYPPNIFNPKPVSGSVVQTRTPSVSITTDESATCKYATQLNAASASAMTPSNGGLLHTAILTLTDGTNTIYFRCRDTAGNEGNDYRYIISYQATEPPSITCGGTAPSGAGVVKSSASGAGTWSYKETGTLNACEWRCADTHVKDGNSCVPRQTATPTCTDVTAETMQVCAGDDIVEKNTRRTLVTACTNAVKCEYQCKPGYRISGDSCVQETSPTGTDCTNPPQFAQLCPGDNSNQAAALVDACTAETKCEYMCITGRVREGSTCTSSSEFSATATATPETPIAGQQFTLSVEFANTNRLFADGLSAGRQICSSSPCILTDTKTSAGTYTYTFWNSELSRSVKKSVTVRASNAPAVEPVFAEPSICQSGGALRLKCRVSDADAADRESFDVEFYAGRCESNTLGNTRNCFDTREWADSSGSYRLLGGKESTGLYSVLFNIPSDSSGKGIAATCRARDQTGEYSRWGDAYPLCVVDVCDNAPRIMTLQTYRGSEQRTQFTAADTLSVKFTSDRALSNAAVRIKTGTNEYDAQRSGSSTAPYEFRLPLSGVQAGNAQVVVSGYQDASCIGSRLADINVEETRTGQTPSSLRLTSSPFAEASGGKKKTTVTATFLDNAGNPMPFAASLVFEVMEGLAMISPPTCSTTPTQSSCAVDVTETTGDASIRARTGTLTSNTLRIEFSSATPACSGTAPSGAGVVKSGALGAGTWSYKETGTLNACEWRCADTHVKDGNSCVPRQTATPTCTDVTAETMQVCAGDDIVEKNTRRTLVTACTNAVKCEYQCKPGYRISGDSCVQETSPTGTDCTNPPQFAQLCPGDNSNQAAALVDACTAETKCEYMCITGRVREGNTCVLSQGGTSIPGRPVSLRVVSNPASIEIGGGSRTSEITATFLNNAGNLLPFAGTITFTTTAGSLIQTSCPTNAQQSSCGVMLQSSNTAGIARVTATWENISNVANVVFTSPASDTTPPNVVNPQPLETVTSLPMTLSFQTDESARCRYSRTPGTAYGNMQSTTPLGRAHQWTLDGLTNGLQRFYIRCEDEARNAAQQDFQHSFNVQVAGNQQVTLLRISPSNPSIQANGVSTTAITARFTNSAGETLASARTVDFTTTAGRLLQNSCSTTPSETTCSVILRSSTTPGIATVSATSGTLSYETGVQFTEQPQPSCTGTLPANSELCSGDNAGLSTDTPITLVSSCSSPKCEYRCIAGYAKQGDTCVPSSSTTQLYNTEIMSLSVVNETPVTTPINASIGIANKRNEARSALVTCRFNSTAVTSACTALAANGNALVQISSLANAPGITTITCSVNSTTAASCQSSALDHTYPSAATTLVTEPKMLYILSGSVPQSLVRGTPINAQISVRNPIEVRYGRVSCTFDRPGGSTVINSSQCLPVGQNSERAYSVPTYADVSGIWMLNSCNVTTSRSSDCSLTDNVSTRTFNSAVNILDRTQLTINSISALLASVQLGDESAVNVSVSNPAQIDKFARVSCRVTRPNSGQNQYSSQCTPMAFQTSKQFLLNFTPTMAGTWTISSCSVDGSVNSDCSASSQEDNFGSSSTVEVLSAGSQFIQPAVSVSHSPAEPNLGETVSVTGTSSSTNIRQIKIYVDDGVVSCSTSPCTYSATYRSGTHRYYATVENTFLQTARDPPANNSYKSFTVRPTAGNATQAAGCSIVITSPSCTFNSRTSRYEVSAVYNWRGGDHSRTIIDGLEKIQTPGTSNFSYSEPLPTPGDKNIIAKVQDSSNRDLCSTSTRLTCSPAAPKEELIVTREMPDVSKLGFIAVRLNLAPGRDINNFTIKEHVIQGLSPLNLAVQSNTSFANISGPRSVSLDRDYSQYTISTALKDGRNVSISYRLNIDKEGEYEFLSVSEYEGKKKEERATLLVTNCEQPVYTLAVSPDGECKKFRTACEVPFDWRRVDQCPILKSETDATGEEGGGGDSTLAIIVVVVVLVALIILSWRYEDEIREKIKELKKRIEEWREGKEEKKPWENEYRANSA